MAERREQRVRIVSVAAADQHCDFCCNLILWATTVAGKPMPLESRSRVGAVLAPALKVRGTHRVVIERGRTRPTPVRSEKHRRELLAAGAHERDEVVEYWEVPSSLTHFANCKRYHRPGTPEPKRPPILPASPPPNPAYDEERRGPRGSVGGYHGD